MLFRKATVLFILTLLFSSDLKAQLEEYLTFTSPRARVDGYATNFDNEGNLIFVIEVQKTEGTVADNTISFGPNTIPSTDVEYPGSFDYRKVIIGSLAPDLSLNWVIYSAGRDSERMRIFDMETSPNGDLYFFGTGQLKDRFLFDETGAFDRNTGQLGSYFIMKISADGVFQWVSRLPAAQTNNSDAFVTIGQELFDMDVDELGTAFAFVKLHSNGNKAQNPTLEVERRTANLWSVDCGGNTAFINPIPQLFDTIYINSEPTAIQLNSHVMDAQLYKDAFYVTVEDDRNSLGGNSNNRLLKLGPKGDLIWEKKFTKNVNMYGMSLHIRDDLLVVGGGYRGSSLSFGNTSLISDVTFTSGCCAIDDFHPFILSTNLDGNLQNYWINQEYNGIVDLKITGCNEVLTLGNPVRVFDTSLNLTSEFAYLSGLRWWSEIYINGSLVIGHNKYSILDPEMIQFTSLQNCVIPENPAEVPIPVEACAGEDRSIGSGLGGNFTYEWLYESQLLPQTTDTLVVDQSGRYVQNVYGPCQNLQKSIAYDFNVLPTPAAPQLSHSDTTYVCEERLLVSATSGAVNWSTGETSQSISITEDGQYWANVTTSLGCESLNSDTLTVVFV